MNRIFLAAAVAATALLSACNGGSPKPSLKSNADTLSYELGMANAPSDAELKRYLADPRVGSDTTYVDEFMKGMRDGLQAANDKRQAAYVAGLQIGTQMHNSMASIESMVFGNDTVSRLSRKNFIAGFKDAMDGKKTALKIDGKLIDKRAATEDVNERIRSMAAAAMREGYAAEIKAAEAFIAKKAKESGVKKLEGGTLYKVITEGDGPVAKKGDRINVIYEGKLTDGTVFDASAQHPGPDKKSYPMNVGQNIPGFDAALLQMPAGSTWEVYIPYDQAYGEQGAGQIEPFSALVFTITVLKAEE